MLKLLQITVIILTASVIMPAAPEQEPPKKTKIHPERQIRLEKKEVLETKQREWDDVFTVTAYTAGPESTGKDPGHPLYGITASGEKVQPGLTIACPPEIELDTKIFIEGIGERVCKDRGAAIQGKRLDLYIPDLDDALEFGAQELGIRIMN